MVRYRKARPYASRHRKRMKRYRSGFSRRYKKTSRRKKPAIGTGGIIAILLGVWYFFFKK